MAIVAVIAIVAAGAGIVFLAMAPGTTSLVPGRPACRARLPAAHQPCVRLRHRPPIRARLSWSVLDAVGAPDLSYHLTAKGKTTFDRKTFESFTETFAVAGDEYSGTIRSHNRGLLLQGIQPSRITAATVARKGGIV